MTQTRVSVHWSWPCLDDSEGQERDWLFSFPSHWPPGGPGSGTTGPKSQRQGRLRSDLRGTYRLGEAWQCRPSSPGVVRTVPPGPPAPQPQGCVCHRLGGGVKWQRVGRVVPAGPSRSRRPHACPPFPPRLVLVQGKGTGINSPHPQRTRRHGWGSPHSPAPQLGETKARRPSHRQHRAGGLATAPNTLHFGPFPGVCSAPRHFLPPTPASRVRAAAARGTRGTARVAPGHQTLTAPLSMPGVCQAGRHGDSFPDKQQSQSSRKWRPRGLGQGA